MLRQRVYNVEHAFQVALDMEEYLRYPITTKIGSQAKEAEFKISVEANHGAKASLSQLFNRMNGSKPYTNLADPKGKGVMSNKS
jgi:hypothetical protein